MDHPPLVPSTFIVYDEQPGDVGEDINEGSGVVGISGKKLGDFFGLYDQPNGANSGKLIFYGPLAGT